LAGNRGYAMARITLAVTQQNQGFKNGNLHDRKYLGAIYDPGGKMFT
jgi:hypothetical protein